MNFIYFFVKNRGKFIIFLKQKGASDGLDCNQLHPDFPSSSPWTTSLGATRLTQTFSDPICSMQINNLPINCAPLAEKACTVDTGCIFTTGGGFSNLISRYSKF